MLCFGLSFYALMLKYVLCGSNEPYVFRCVAFCCALFCYIKKFEGSKDTDIKDSEFEGVNGKVNEEMDLEEEFEAEGEEKEKIDLSFLKSLNMDYNVDVYETAYDDLYRSVLIASTMARYGEPHSDIYKFLRKAANEAENTVMLHMGIKRHREQVAERDLSFLFNGDFSSGEKY